MTQVFGRPSFLRQQFGLYPLSQDFHQSTQQNCDGSKAVTPKSSSTLDKQHWDRHVKVKLNKWKALFCDLAPCLHGRMLRNITVTLKLCLAHPFQMVRTAQEGFSLVNHAWGFCPAEHVQRQHLRALQGNIQQNTTHTLITCSRNWKSWLLSCELWYQNPKYATRLSADGTWTNIFKWCGQTWRCVVYGQQELRKYCCSIAYGGPALPGHKLLTVTGKEWPRTYP